MKTVLLSGGWDGFFEMLVVMFLGSIAFLVLLVSLVLMLIDKNKGRPVSTKKRKLAVFSTAAIALCFLMILVLRAVYVD